MDEDASTECSELKLCVLASFTDAEDVGNRGRREALALALALAEGRCATEETLGRIEKLGDADADTRVLLASLEGGLHDEDAAALEATEVGFSASLASREALFSTSRLNMARLTPLSSS